MVWDIGVWSHTIPGMVWDSVGLAHGMVYSWDPPRVETRSIFRPSIIYAGRPRIILTVSICTIVRLA